MDNGKWIMENDLYMNIPHHPEGIDRYVEHDAPLGPSHHAEGVAQRDNHKQCSIPTAWRNMVVVYRFLHSDRSLRDGNVLYINTSQSPRESIFVTENLPATDLFNHRVCTE